ncbi:MAG TPA: hypothetical protein VHD32_06170 [Candidatus Didemnitutus sp.]|nr:hypothetical protein [Candidatus Didemnitutus sp.]
MKTKYAALLCVVAASLGFLVARLMAATTFQPANAVNRVAFENDRVRVIDYQAGAGGPVCGFGKHSHPAHLAILLTDSKVRVTDAAGKTHIEDGKAGEMFWEPAATHEEDDISGQASRCYVIELKDKDWAPSTGVTK